MKKLLVVVAVLSFGRTAECAFFDYYGGGLRVFCEVYAEDFHDTTGVINDSNEGSTATDLEQYGEVTDAYSYAYSTIFDFNYPEYNSVSLRANSYVEVFGADAYSSVAGYAYGSTMNASEYGLFYQIAPGPNEQSGDDVLVYVSLTVKAVVWGEHGYVYVGAPETLPHMSVTRGLEPPVVAAPDPNYEVWTVENLESWAESFDSFTGIDSFEAKIGDVIGIFADNYTDIIAAGASDEVAESDLTIVLTVKSVLKGDLDGDGDVDLYDFAALGQNWLTAAP